MTPDPTPPPSDADRTLINDYVMNFSRGSRPSSTQQAVARLGLAYDADQVEIEALCKALEEARYEAERSARPKPPNYVPERGETYSVMPPSTGQRVIEPESPELIGLRLQQHAVRHAEAGCEKCARYYDVVLPLLAQAKETTQKSPDDQ